VLLPQVAGSGRLANIQEGVTTWASARTCHLAAAKSDFTRPRQRCHRYPARIRERFDLGCVRSDTAVSLARESAAAAPSAVEEKRPPAEGRPNGGAHCVRAARYSQGVPDATGVRTAVSGSSCSAGAALRTDARIAGERARARWRSASSAQLQARSSRRARIRLPSGLSLSRWPLRRIRQGQTDERK
jgi:hypothetical protein